MRYLLTAFIFLAFLIGCEKEPIETSTNKDNITFSIDSIYNYQDSSNTFMWLREFPEDRGNRFGNTAPLFFQGSFSLDNQNMPNQVRTQMSFNHLATDSVKLIRIGTSTASVQYSTVGANGTTSQPILTVGKYLLNIKFKNESNYREFGEVVTKLVGDVYVYKPSNGLLFNANQNKWIKTIRLSTTRQHYHLLNGKIKIEYQHDILADDNSLRKEFLESSTTSSVFIFNHVM